MIQKLVRMMLIGVIIIFTVSCDESTDPVDNGPSNLLLNSDIEGGEDGLPTYWTPMQVGNYELTWSSGTSFSGTHSLKVSIDQMDTENFVGWYQTVCMYVPVNQDITFKAKIKLENVTGDGIFIAVRGDDRNGENHYFDTTQGEREITGTHDWQEYSISFERFSNLVQCISVFLIYSSNTTGTVYFDDVKLEY